MQHLLKSLGATLLPFAIAWIGALAPAPAFAAQSYDNCTGFIDSVPATIQKQGTWCLRHDLATSLSSGQAIEIGNNNITIDCNHFKLGDLGAGVGTDAVGIHADRMLNTTIRNCNIRGFFSGISLVGDSGYTSAGSVVEDNRLDGNTSRGVVVTGDNAVIRRNIILNTGGSTSAGLGAYGILAVYDVDILDNTVNIVMPIQTDCDRDAYGIYASNSVGGSIDGNRVRQVIPACGGVAYGIFSTFDSKMSITNNVVVRDAASLFSLGLSCSSGTSRARHNVVIGFDTAITGCLDDGNSL
jgi:hypothetical protein